MRVVGLSEQREKRIGRGEAEDEPGWDAVIPNSRCQITPFPKPEIADAPGAARSEDIALSAAKLESVALTIALLPAVMSLHFFALGCASLLHVTNYGGSTCSDHQGRTGGISSVPKGQNPAGRT
jgi:hypothetical protein